ncbi:MAG: hypothetical protein ACTSYJ_08690 [Candidatus Thorarchaeota archaeon]
MQESQITTIEELLQAVVDRRLERQDLEVLSTNLDDYMFAIFSHFKQDDEYFKIFFRVYFNIFSGYTVFEMRRKRKGEGGEIETISAPVGESMCDCLS